MKKSWIVLGAIYELFRYEVIVSSRGVGRVFSQLKRQSVNTKPTSPALEEMICDAFHLATCFYWKPVLCLQRAVCTVRLLRRYGIAARLVITRRVFPTRFCGAAPRAV